MSKDLGVSTSYAYYVAEGGTKTPQEYGEMLVNIDTVATRAEDAADSAAESATGALNSKNAAQTAATTATNKASEATTAATTATTKAGEASTSASTATSAKDTAVSASQTATTKASEATTAAATATSAATTATTAKDDAVSAKTAAQTAQTGAETAAASVQSSAAQIQTNADDISELKEDLTHAFPHDTVSGAVASFADGADDVPMDSVIVSIDPVQSGSGDPSPTNVRPISGWSEVNVNACGVNIWDEQWESGLISVSNGQNITGSGIRSKNYSPCTPSTEYRFVFGSGTTKYVFWYDADHNYISNNAVTDIIVRFTSPPNAKYFKLRADTIATYNNDFSANYPSTDTDYYPYSGQSITISLGQTVYGGTLDVVSGVLTVDYEHLLLDGSEGWNLQSVNSHGIANFARTASIPSYTTPVDLICNRLPLQTSIIAETTTEGIMPSGNTNIYIRLNSSRASTVAELKQWLTSNNVEVVYKIRTPLTIQLTPHEVRSLLGSNNVWADTGDSTVIYRADPTLYISRLTEPDADMIADSNITSGQYFMVGNTLYKATANIASGATISPNVNCTRKSLSEALNELNV